jgi:hypothetical protein
MTTTTKARQARTPGQMSNKTTKSARTAARKDITKGKLPKVAAKPAIGQEPAMQERKPRGRPSKYRPEFCGLMRAFFDIPVEKEIECVTVPDGRGGYTKRQNVVVNRFPTITRFASTIGLTSETLRRWATAMNADGTKKYPAFAFAYESARDCQFALLMEGGLAGLYDSRFTMMTLKNLFGWRTNPEPGEVEATASASIAALDAIYAEGIQCAEKAQQASHAPSTAAGAL